MAVGVAIAVETRGNSELDPDPTLLVGWADDGVRLAGDNEFTPSCEGNPSQETWANLDYMGDTCGGTLEDRGTYLDWMRAFWDADQGQGLTTEQIFDLWDEANPKDWDSSGGGITSADDPQERLEAAALSLSVSTEWNNVDNVNGVR
ncbi:MAG: hypothetical protein ABMA64_17060 [Myxococcota bacterium]